MATRIDRIRPDEGPLFRELRIRALTDAPMAFGATLEETLARPPAAWADRVLAASAGDREGIWLARVTDPANAIAGMVGAFTTAEQPDVPRLISMWVDPAHRRLGIGRQLVDDVLVWASRRRAAAVVLDVESTNETARGLYESAGFTPTGASAPMPWNPSVTTVELRVELAS